VHGSHDSNPAPPNGWRVSGEPRSEAQGRVRCTRVLGRLLFTLRPLEIDHS
jgi:hypothetical protein